MGGSVCNLAISVAADSIMEVIYALHGFIDVRAVMAPSQFITAGKRKKKKKKTEEEEEEQS